MLVRQIADSKLAQFAYLIGCPKTGEAIVIDPERDVDRYFDLADEFAAHRGKLEVQAAFERIHVAAGDQRTVIAKHRPTQDVERRMSTHELISPRPIQGPE